MKKLTAKEVFTREAYEGLTAEERRSALKVEQAKEYSGWRAYPDTCAELVDFIPDDWWSKYPAQHISERLCLCSNPLLTWELTKAAAKCNIKASGG